MLDEQVFALGRQATGAYGDAGALAFVARNAAWVACSANHLSLPGSVSPTDARATIVVANFIRAGSASTRPSLFSSCHASSKAASTRWRVSGLKYLGISLSGITLSPSGVGQTHRAPSCR